MDEDDFYGTRTCFTPSILPSTGSSSSQPATAQKSHTLNRDSSDEDSSSDSESDDILEVREDEGN